MTRSTAGPRQQWCPRGRGSKPAAQRHPDPRQLRRLHRREHRDGSRPRRDQAAAHIRGEHSGGHHGRHADRQRWIRRSASARLCPGRRQHRVGRRARGYDRTAGRRSRVEQPLNTAHTDRSTMASRVRDLRGESLAASSWRPRRPCLVACCRVRRQPKVAAVQCRMQRKHRRHHRVRRCQRSINGAHRRSGTRFNR